MPLNALPSNLLPDNFQVRVLRAKITNMSMRVALDDATNSISVTVKAPNRQHFGKYVVSDLEIGNFVASKQRWIAKQAQRLKMQPHANLISVDELKSHSRNLVSYWCERMNVVPIVDINALRFRKMKTRWGVCNTATRVITINTELAKYPPEALEYVVVHELAHLQVVPKKSFAGKGERPHSQRFWDYVYEYLPDWKSRRAML